MATYVAHRQTGIRYLLLGTGYAATESATPGVLLGNLSPNVETRTFGMVAVCDAGGTILWAPSEELQVVAIDGVAPAALLARS